MLGVAGVTEMDRSVGGAAMLTINVVLPEMLPDAAVMTDPPTPLAVATPLAAIVATSAVPDDQVTADPISHDVPSE
jgi:hypothetical protein